MSKFTILLLALTLFNSAKAITLIETPESGGVFSWSVSSIFTPTPIQGQGWSHQIGYWHHPYLASFDMHLITDGQSGVTYDAEWVFDFQNDTVTANNVILCPCFSRISNSSL